MSRLLCTYTLTPITILILCVVGVFVRARGVGMGVCGGVCVCVCFVFVCLFLISIFFEVKNIINLYEMLKGLINQEERGCLQLFSLIGGISFYFSTFFVLIGAKIKYTCTVLVDSTVCL